MFQRVLLDFVLKTFGLGAENETRTRDPNLGKVVLYQLSYFRKYFCGVLFSTLSGKRDSNSRPQPWQGCALPTELFPHYLLNSTTDISTELRVQRYSIFRYFQNFL